MNGTRIIAIALILAGSLGLLYGGFSYTKDSKEIKIGSVELSVKEKQTVNIPMWAGVGAILVGGLLLVLGGKKS
jgi:TRAP-type C4-dicarboxylate transport system permease small subunit